MGGSNPLAEVTTLQLPRERLDRWVENFVARHGAVSFAAQSGSLLGVGADGSAFTLQLPFAAAYDGELALGEFKAALTPPVDWGVLLVRKGGFAVARLHGDTLVDSKVGQRHVQGRTKAGGQSQQRFARRRDNQARQAFEAATEHAIRLLGGLGVVVTGGDRTAVDAVLQDARLARLIIVDPWLPVPDPRRAVLEGAIRDAQSLTVTVTNN